MNQASAVNEEEQLEEQAEEKSVEDAAKLSSKLIYEVIRRDGEEELARSNRALFWSGIAAGIMISLSVLGEAIFRTYLPDQPSSYLIENLGYSLGFLVVILGRMQLFTENTITTVLPLMRDPCLNMLNLVARLWAIVLAANVVGAFAVAALFVHTAAIPSELLPALYSLSEHAVGMPPWDSFLRAIPAGVLVASIVWMLPQAEGAAFLVITVFTWLIAAGDFTHIVAGSVEYGILVMAGEISILEGFTGFFVPVFLGNVVGGTVIFTLIAWGQVRDEVREEEKRKKMGTKYVVGR